MINVTDFVKYYSKNFQEYFQDTEMIEYEEDILRAIINQTFEMIREGEIAEIQECIAINIRQYFQDTYIESSDIGPEDAENDSYEFIYQYNIVDELYNVLKDVHNKFTESNGIEVVWSEDTEIDLLTINNDIYLTFFNSGIVKYTDVFDLHNCDKLSKKGLNRLIDLSNEFILFNNIVGDNHKHIFFTLLEYYLSLKERTVEKLYKEYLDIIPVYYDGTYANKYTPISFEQFLLIFNIFNQGKINSIIFNGWIRDSLKIRSTNVV